MHFIPHIKKSTFKKIVFGLFIIIIGYASYAYVDIVLALKAKEEACFAQLALTFTERGAPEEIFEKDFEKVLYLVEHSLVARSQMLEVSARLKENLDKPLSSRDLIILKKGTEDYLDIREDLYNIANAYECAIELEESTLAAYGVDQELRLKGAMLSLSAALTLYDNYLIGTIMFEQDSRLRKIINDPDMGFGLVANTLMEMTLSANSIETRHRVRKVINFYEKEKASLASVHEDSDFAYLQLLIESSPSYNYVKKIRVSEIASKKFVAFERITADMMSESSKDGFDLLSGLFGNTLGLYESRKGKLYGDEEAIKNIKATLQPLDILLEKTPFRLTDKLIPGHFGHVAIWTGTKAELIDMNLWHNIYVEPHAEAISSPNNLHSKDEHQIVEALRSGVQLSTLEHFMNIDDFAILRPVFKEGNREMLTKEALIMAFR